MAFLARLVSRFVRESTPPVAYGTEARCPWETIVRPVSNRVDALNGEVVLLERSASSASANGDKQHPQTFGRGSGQRSIKRTRN